MFFILRLLFHLFMIGITDGFWLIVLVVAYLIKNKKWRNEKGMFYMGEKVICVKRIFRSDVNGLTLNKEYEIIKEDKFSYLIVDDNNKTFLYDKNNFKKL